MFNKKAQVSESVIWIVATLIIVLIGSIFIASILGKAKGFDLSDSDTDVDGANLLKAKTNFVYSLTSDENKKIIDDWRSENE